MPHRLPLLAAATAATLIGFSLEIQAQPSSLQDARPAPFALPADRAAWDEDKLLALRVTSPSGVAGAELGWAKATETRPGGGLQLDLDQGWALYADWDRYRTKLPQVRETVDTLLVGLHYKFP
jgi:hypothetical protein